MKFNILEREKEKLCVTGTNKQIGNSYYCERKGRQSSMLARYWAPFLLIGNWFGMSNDTVLQPGR